MKTKIPYAVLLLLMMSSFASTQVYAQGDELMQDQAQTPSSEQNNDFLTHAQSNNPNNPNNPIQTQSNDQPKVESNDQMQGQSNNSQQNTQLNNQPQAQANNQPQAQTNNQPQTQAHPQNEDFNRRRQAFVAKINEYRASLGLPALKRWTSAESCTDRETIQDAQSNSPHANMGNCGERAQNTCPNYPSMDSAYSTCLQQMWDEGPPPSQPCTGDCYEKHGHYIAMSNKNYTQVAVGFYKLPNGSVWVNMNFK